MAKSISVDGISMAYGSGASQLEVLRDINFEVNPKELLVIVGPSGCGKTTLLKMMNGLVEPTEGRIILDDATVTKPTPEASMVFQSFELLPWRTVTENVALGLKVQGVTKDRRIEIATDWIDRVGLEGFEDALPTELSGGMKQRVGLARALAVNPDVLLMDEPFGSLDAQTKDKMQTQLLQLWQEQQKTIVFVTHDINEAAYLADRILVLSSKPAQITQEVHVDIDRPRWNRRFEVENLPQFAEIEKALREELGLTVD